MHLEHCLHVFNKVLQTTLPDIVTVIGWVPTPTQELPLVIKGAAQ